MAVVVEGTLGQQTGQTQRGLIVLMGTLNREETKETHLDGVSVMGNSMLGRRSLVSPKVWQPGCRLQIHPTGFGPKSPSGTAVEVNPGVESFWSKRGM